MKYRDEYRNRDVAQGLVTRIHEICKRPVRIMEVCGTHTMSIFRNGIRELLPAHVDLLSGPGCPVCVTTQGEMDAFIGLAREKDIILTTFGDLMRVPGSETSLEKEKAMGSDIRVVYSSFDALEIAANHPEKKVVFLGVGFETTAPTIAASMVLARQRRISNFSVFCVHKLVPPVLDALLEDGQVRVDGFLLPGHVSVIIGRQAYLPIFERYGVPGAIAGFEPVDILQGIWRLIRQMESGQTGIENCYPRVVKEEGNPKARDLMNTVFETTDACWRGLGTIPQSGLKISDPFAAYDAQRIFQVSIRDVPEPEGCACGQILSGIKTPDQCPLFERVCTPLAPVGPCMVSSEGTCAAYYRYRSRVA